MEVHAISTVEEQAALGQYTPGNRCTGYGHYLPANVPECLDSPIVDFVSRY
jgi:hypothetical protein